MSKGYYPSHANSKNAVLLKAWFYGVEFTQVIRSH